MTAMARRRVSAVGETLPSAIVVWKLGSRLLQTAGNNPTAQRWARIGAVAAGVVGVAAVLTAISSALDDHDAERTDQRLDDELEDSFPASDPPAVTRA